MSSARMEEQLVSQLENLASRYANADLRCLIELDDVLNDLISRSREAKVRSSLGKLKAVERLSALIPVLSSHSAYLQPREAALSFPHPYAQEQPAGAAGPAVACYHMPPLQDVDAASASLSDTTRRQAPAGQDATATSAPLSFSPSAMRPLLLLLRVLRNLCAGVPENQAAFRLCKAPSRVASVAENLLAALRGGLFDLQRGSDVSRDAKLSGLGEREGSGFKDRANLSTLSGTMAYLKSLQTQSPDFDAPVTGGAAAGSSTLEANGIPGPVHNKAPKESGSVQTGTLPQDAVDLLRAALQVLGNFLGGRDAANQEAVWLRCYPRTFAELADVQVAAVQGPLCMVLFTCCRNCDARCQQLCDTREGICLMRALLRAAEPESAETSAGRPGDNNSDKNWGRGGGGGGGGGEWLELLVGGVCKQRPWLPRLFRGLSPDAAGPSLLSLGPQAGASTGPGAGSSSGSGSGSGKGERSERREMVGGAGAAETPAGATGPAAAAAAQEEPAVAEPPAAAAAQGTGRGAQPTEAGPEQADEGRRRAIAGTPLLPPPLPPPPQAATCPPLPPGSFSREQARLMALLHESLCADLDALDALDLRNPRPSAAPPTSGNISVRSPAPPLLPPAAPPATPPAAPPGPAAAASAPRVAPVPVAALSPAPSPAPAFMPASASTIADAGAGADAGAAAGASAGGNREAGGEAPAHAHASGGALAGGQQKFFSLPVVEPSLRFLLQALSDAAAAVGAAQQRGPILGPGTTGGGSRTNGGGGSGRSSYVGATAGSSGGGSSRGGTTAGGSSSGNSCGDGSAEVELRPLPTGEAAVDVLGYALLALRCICAWEASSPLPHGTGGGEQAGTGAGAGVGAEGGGGGGGKSEAAAGGAGASPAAAATGGARGRAPSTPAGDALAGGREADVGDPVRVLEDEGGLVGLLLDLLEPLGEPSRAMASRKTPAPPQREPRRAAAVAPGEPLGPPGEPRRAVDAGEDSKNGEGKGGEGQGEGEDEEERKREKRCVEHEEKETEEERESSSGGGASGCDSPRPSSPSYPRFCPYVGYRRDVVAVLANALHGRRRVQDAVGQRPGGVLAVLWQCQVDDANPLLREWGLWAVRNLMAGHLANQREVEELEVVAGADSPELADLGLRVEINERTHRPKLVNIPR